MLLEGREVARTSGRDIDKMKDSLIRSYFHLPKAPE